MAVIVEPPVIRVATHLENLEKSGNFDTGQGNCGLPVMCYTAVVIVTK